MASFILSAAIRAVKSKAGVWRAYDAVAGIVPEVTKTEWAQAIGDARAALANRVLESTRPLNRRPTAAEFSGTLNAKSRFSIWQTVEVFVRDRETGARSSFPVRIGTDSLRSRLSVVSEAVGIVRGIVDSAPDDYPVDIVGFEYTGTYHITRARR